MEKIDELGDLDQFVFTAEINLFNRKDRGQIAPNRTNENDFLVTPPKHLLRTGIDAI